LGPDRLEECCFYASAGPRRSRSALSQARATATAARSFEGRAGGSFPESAITIRTERDLANASLHLCVTNYGISIKDSERESVFAKGLRTPLARKFATSGLGIGLFVTRELMKRMGGTAYVEESVPTGGRYKRFDEFRTTIVLTLPDSVLLGRGGRVQ
jgi:signal transduction histidine kinase